MRNKLPNIKSNDGRFHNGNPATGSLGTVVDDVWLNNVQDSLQDFFDELNNVLALVSVQANPAKKTQVAEAIAALIGNVRRVADSNTRSLQNVIYNSKKSNAIDSPSSDTVATSYALKTAYDKALQAERLASLYSAEIADNVHCDHVTDGIFVTNVGTPNNENCYVINLKYKHSQSRGQIAISYWDANPKMWIRNKYDNERYFSAWRRIDGTDWADIRNKVYASTELYGLAKYSDAINLDSSEFAASSRAVKLLNDKKVDKLIEQTLDLTHLNSDHWYPVVLQMPSSRRRTYRFVVRTTLGESSATWGTHSAGFGVYLEWEAQPSGWGTWSDEGLMRVVHQFNVSHANQSPVLKIGQLREISGEYIHLRGGARYTLYREEGIVVTLTGTDYRWEQQSGSLVYRQHLPVITRYDESLVPKTTRQALKDEIDTKANQATSLTGYGITDFAVSTYRGDLNTLRTDGIYSINSYADAQNMPISSSGHVMVIGGGDGNQRWCRQIYKRHYSGETYERWQTSADNDVWSAWERTDRPLTSRRDYSRTIRGIASGQTGNQMEVVGSVHIHPDGRIVQILHLKHFRDFWFELEDGAVGYRDGARGYQIPLQLWTAMPNKVLLVQPQLMRSTHPTSSVTYAGGEAGEHICAWDLRKQGASRDRVTINMSRFRGSESEHIDMYVVVEGY